jgi:CubicO group peptidase (beta-lactamase class C family)
MRELVFKKSQMVSTEPDDSFAIIRHRAPGYQLTDKTLRRAELSDVSGNLPAGGHLATATDLVMFADAFASGKLVSRETISLMVPQQSRNDRQRVDAWRDAIPSRANYGYGLMAFPSIEGRWIGHTGRQPGASAIVITSIDKSLSIAVLSNVKGWNGYISFDDRL